MNEKTVIYAFLVAAAVLAGFVLYGVFAHKAGAAPVTPAGSPGIPSECGDITNPSNVQHLSHHPNLYGACIKLVDPAIFKEAVGMDKATYMQKNGIQ